MPHDRVVTVIERTSPDGQAVIALTDEEIGRVVRQVQRLKPESVAISLLFSYAGNEHERRLADALTTLNVPITRSSVLLPEFREFERASTCVLNAAIEPVMRRYLSNLTARLPGPTITVMTSGGGTAGVDFVAAAPVHTLLSGPAAGVVAAGAVARGAGFEDAIALDMGGTSTDVCLIKAGQPEVSARSRRRFRTGCRRPARARWTTCSSVPVATVTMGRSATTRRWAAARAAPLAGPACPGYTPE